MTGRSPRGRAFPAKAIFMRWADGAGVESYERDISWVREIRARTVLTVSKGRGKKSASVMGEYGAPYGGLSALERALGVAAEAAKASGCLAGGFMAEAEISVEARECYVPRVADAEGVFGEMPHDWFVEEPAALRAWLLASAKDMRIEHPAKRLEERAGPFGAVWKSKASPGENLSMAAAFSGACGIARDPEAAGRSPGM